jgi:hypothetical protein
MNDEDRARVITAIGQQGRGNSAPSQPILTLLTEFAGQGKLREMAEAFVLFRAAHRPNAQPVAESVPAKVLNAYFMKDGAVKSEAFTKWSADQRKGWSDEIKRALTSPSTFETLVRTMRDELLGLGGKNRAANDSAAPGQKRDMTKTRDFQFDGRDLTVRAVPFNEGWRVQVFQGDRAVTRIVYTVAHETVADSSMALIPADLVDELMTLAQTDVEHEVVKLVA